MLHPIEIDETPDVVSDGQDVVLLSRYIALAAAYRDLHDTTKPASRIARGWTLTDKLAVMYPRATVSKLVSLLYRATEPLEKRAIAEHCDIAMSSFNTFLARAKREDDLQVLCLSMTRVYDVATDSVSHSSTYALAQATRDVIDEVLAHPAVAYGDDAITVPILQYLAERKVRERDSGSTPRSIALTITPKPLVKVVQLVLRQMESRGLVMIDSRNKQTYKISNEGRAYLKAHTFE